MKAFCRIRDQPVYRRDAFLRGLVNAGYDVAPIYAEPVGAPGDVLVIWNRYGDNHELASRFERAGGKVVVAENGYVGVDRNNRQRYALALAGHNGSGSWPVGDGQRWNALGIELQPWRTEGTHILICPNRSFGMPGFIQPGNWPAIIADRVRAVTRRPIRIRPHPGNEPPRKSLSEDLADAWACVIWSSSAGCEALIAGIPVFQCAPWWSMGSAACTDLKLLDNPPLPYRMAACWSVAWQQWHVKEIESGEPFQHLLHRSPAFAGRV